MADPRLLAKILKAVSAERISHSLKDTTASSVALGRYSRFFINLPEDVYPQLDTDFARFSAIPEHIKQKAQGTETDTADFTDILMLLTPNDYDPEGKIAGQWKENLSIIAKTLYEIDLESGKSYVELIFDKIKMEGDKLEDYEASIVEAYVSGYASVVTTHLGELTQAQGDDNLTLFNSSFLRQLGEAVDIRVIAADTKKNAEKNAGYTQTFRQYVEAHSPKLAAEMKDVTANNFDCFGKEDENLYALLSKVFGNLPEEEFIYLLDEVLDACKDILLENVFKTQFISPKKSEIIYQSAMHFATNPGKEYAQSEKAEILAIIKDLRQFAEKLDQENKLTVNQCADEMTRACNSAYAGNRYLRASERDELKQKIVWAGVNAFETIKIAKVTPTKLEIFIGLFSKLINSVSRRSSSADTSSVEFNDAKSTHTTSSTYSMAPSVSFKATALPYFFRKAVEKTQQKLDTILTSEAPEAPKTPDNHRLSH
jgi:hypothetical protein